MLTDLSSTRSTQTTGVTSTTGSLLAGLKHQDSQVWGHFVKLYTPLVCHWCQRYQLKNEDIPDVVQEVFRSVARYIERFHKDRPEDTFRGWLRVITRNKALDLHRRRGRDVPIEEGTEARRRLELIPAPEDCERDASADLEDRSIVYHRALELIRSEFRDSTWTAFWQVVLEGRSAVDVADDLGMSPGAVRVAKCRVLQRLRSELVDPADIR